MTAAHHPITDTDDVGTPFDDLPTTETPAPAEVPARRQPGSLVDLWLAGGEDVEQVRVLNRDRIAYEMTAAKPGRGWPSMSEGQNFAMTFVIWNALKREGRTAVPFDKFQDVLLDFEVVKESGSDPTQ